MKLIAELFFIFAKIGLFTFGGGYAMFPIIKREIIENRKWITEEELIDYYAIGQCTPGIIAVNVATFTGYKLKGFWGAVASTAGVVTPSVIIITVIAKLIKNFANLWFVQSAFSGIRVVVVLLILNTVISMWKKSIKNAFHCVVFAIAFVLSFFNIVSSVIVILLCGFAGALYTVKHGGANL
ncbi:MAG: chromate transporter [Clostridia bacterium]|nr:chromate transporter [Clostridia bacterium]